MRLTDDQGAPLGPVFSFAVTDRAFAGEWGWHLLADGTSLLNFVFDISRSSWTEVRGQTAGGHRRHREMDVAVLTPAAIARLQELELDLDQLFRFRLSGAARLWGFVIQGVFHTLWWDPNHRVYPTDPE